MDVERDGDYREGLFWLIGGGAFVIMGVAQFSDWLGVQPWFFYALGTGLLVVAAIIAPRRISPSRLRRLWLPLVVALVLSASVAAISADVSFSALFPLVVGLLWVVSGLWLMLRRDTPASGSGR